MRTILRRLGIGRFLYENFLRPAQLIHMLLRDSDDDVRRIQLLHLGRSRTLTAPPSLTPTSDATRASAFLRLTRWPGSTTAG